MEKWGSPNDVHTNIGPSGDGVGAIVDGARVVGAYVGDVDEGAIVDFSVGVGVGENFSIDCSASSATPTTESSQPDAQ
jgi:hypothetical protein